MGCGAVLRRVERLGFGMPWEESHGYSQAVRVGTSVHISGQIPHDGHGEIVGLGDPVVQAQAVFANLDRVLAGVGASKRQVVETFIMVVGLSANFEAVSQAHKAYFDDHRPASTAIGVSELAFPGQLVEMTARVSLELPR
jgi:2-iminobutanoate/2-iminopropanoate deaminase